MKAPNLMVHYNQNLGGMSVEFKASGTDIMLNGMTSYFLALKAR